MTNEIPQPAYTTLLRQSIEYLDESLGQPQLIDSLGALGVSAVALQQRAAMLTVADVRTGATQRELDDHDGAEPRLFQCDHQVQSLDGWHRRDIIPLAIAPETRDVWTDMTDPMPLQRQQAGVAHNAPWRLGAAKWCYAPSRILAAPHMSAQAAPVRIRGTYAACIVDMGRVGRTPMHARPNIVMNQTRLPLHDDSERARIITAGVLLHELSHANDAIIAPCTPWGEPPYALFSSELKAYTLQAQFLRQHDISPHRDLSAVQQIETIRARINHPERPFDKNPTIIQALGAAGVLWRMGSR